MSKRSRKIARGLSRGPVAFADAGPVVLSGDTPFALRLETGDKTSICLSREDSPAVLLAEGNAAEMSRLFHDICRDMARPPLAERAAAFSIGALAGAAAVAAVWLMHPFPSSEGAPADPASVAERLSLPPVLEELRRAAEKAVAEGAAAGEGGHAEEAGGASVTPILDLPDFLAVPGQDPGAKAVDQAAPEAPVPVSGGDPSGVPAAPAEADGLPPYVPPVPDAEGENPDAEAEPASEDAEKAEPDQAAVSGTPEGNDEGGKESARANGAEGGEPAVEPISPAEAREQAQKAAQSLIEKGLTPDKAKDVLSQLEALGRADLSEITPDMLAGLPHEVAQMLIDGGFVNLDAAPGGVPYSIIRLPESVIDKHRGPDGIASIPERNTWASTGNFVSIPLPGGGDIRTPDDLKEFHLQP